MLMRRVGKKGGEGGGVNDVNAPQNCFFLHQKRKEGGRKTRPKLIGHGGEGKGDCPPRYALTVLFACRRKGEGGGEWGGLTPTA